MVAISPKPQVQIMIGAIFYFDKFNFKNHSMSIRASEPLNFLEFTCSNQLSTVTDAQASVKIYQ